MSAALPFPAPHVPARGAALSSILILSAALALAGCGGGASPSTGTSSADTPSTDGVVDNGNSPSVGTLGAASAVFEPTPCVASGVAGATDHTVGPGQTHAELHEVPWESLRAGDTVRIHHRSTAYSGKFLIAAEGRADAPVRVCGVRGPNQERPVIDGHGASTRTALAPHYANTQEISDIHQGRSIIVIKNKAGTYTGTPAHIQIDGLSITRAHPQYTYVNAQGATKNYIAFGAAIWIDRGHHITIADNEISDSQMAVFSKSTDDGDFAVSRDIRIARNDFHGHGIVGDVHMHTTYTQSVGLVIEFNRYGPLRSGASGNSIKDRSAGTVVRYNRIEDGAHAIDLVEAEDFPITAQAEPSYRYALVHGNLISKPAGNGSVIHYGGDHYGSTAGANWGESLFRRGTLYFFNNTVHAQGSGDARIFQLATTLETAEVWNNVFLFDATVTNRNLRQTTDLNGSAWTPGGIVNLGVNWASAGWQDSDIYHPVPGQLNGTARLISGSHSPLDLATYRPLAGSAAVDAGVAGPAAVSGHPTVHQIDANGIASGRSVNGAAIDLGALER
ncbi:hypothetical protein [Sphaerotilus mobilis]|nr:hypothetical protein [Sphaerotilus mobilis]